MLNEDKPVEDNSENSSNHTVPPSVFLQNLSAKINGFQGGNGNSIAEVQRVRTELSNQVQSISNKQEIQMRQLDSQLSMLQQEIRPKLQNIERQQGFTQKQLEEIRQRAQKLQMEDLSPLQYKFDQMGIKFDRFMRVELESKLKPLQDDLRQSRAKLDELSSTLNTNFRKIDDQVNEMSQKVKSLDLNLGNQKSSYEEQINTIEPRLNSLEREITELSESLSGNDSRGVNENASNGLNGNSDDLDSQLSQMKEAFNRLQNETIPASINESSSNLIEALQKVTQFCDEQLASLQSPFDSIICSNEFVDRQRKQAEDQLDQLHKSNFEIQNRLTSLDQDSKSQLSMLEQAIESKTLNLRSLLSNLNSDVDNSSEKTQNAIEDNLKELKDSIQSSLRKLRENIRLKSLGNLEAQNQMLSQLSQLKNLLYGKENAVGRLESAESRIKWCIDSIQEIDNERLEAQKINGGPKNVSIRIKSIEERLKSINDRIDKLENKTKTKTKEVKITPEETTTGDNDREVNQENDDNDKDKKGDKDKKDKKDEKDKKDKKDDDDKDKKDKKGEKDKKDKKDKKKSKKGEPDANPNE